jgi:hypothetical protein
MEPLIRCVVVVVLVFAMPMLAQAQVTPHSKRVLQQEITRSKAVEVNPAVINRAVERLPEPDSQPAPTPESAEPSPGVAEPAPAAADATAAEETTPEAAAVIPRPHRGQLLYVRLDAPAEKVAQTLLAEQVAAVDTESTSTLQSFQGAVRQLAEDDQEVQLKSYVLVGQPLQYDPQSKQSVGTVLVGVADLFGEGGPRSLTVPLQFEVLESALVDPHQVALQATSPPYQRIRVTSRVIGQPVTLRIASNFSLEGVSVQVPVEPTLIVDVDGDTLRAFGMQTAKVTVRAIGGNTRPQGAVTLSAPHAFLPDPAPPAFDEQGIARATMRTDSPGEIVVTAVAAGYSPGTSLPVKVIWPWPTLVATCVGGFIGGFVRLAGRIRRGMNVGRFIVGLVVSVFVGVIVFALYVVGVKLLPVSFSVEIGDIFAFAAASLAGWLGTGVLPQK